MCIRDSHISGLPGLLLSMGNAERTEPLTMIGPKGLERVVEMCIRDSSSTLRVVFIKPDDRTSLTP